MMDRCVLSLRGKTELSKGSKVLFTILLGALVLGFAQRSSATTVGCTQYQTTYGVSVFQRLIDVGECWLQIDPSDDSQLVYRNFLLTDDGAFLVFNSYGDGDESTHTGGAMYYTFPRDRNPDVKQDLSGNLEISSATSAVTFQMQTATGRFLSVSNGSLVEDTQVVATNDGGLHIKNLSTLWLDNGFQLGSDPRSDKTRKSVFHDRNGKTCAVVNSSLFTYTSSDVSFKFDDKALAAFLATTCPELEVNF